MRSRLFIRIGIPLLFCIVPAWLLAQSKIGPIVLDASEAVKSGAWVTATNRTKSGVGQVYVHDGNANKGQLLMTFTPDLPKTGEYDVELIYPTRADCATNVPVKIVAVGLAGESSYEQTRIVNERKKGANGVGSLGKFYLPKGRNSYFTISNGGTHGCVAVESLRFTPRF